MEMKDKNFDELLAVSEKIVEQNIALSDRVLELEQRHNEGWEPDIPGSHGPNLAKTIRDSSQFKSLMSGTTNRIRLEVKTAIINSTGQNQPLVPAEHLVGVVHGANRRLHLRDLLAVGQTTSNTIEYAKESVFTNNAGPQVGGSPESFENVLKK